MLNADMPERRIKKWVEVQFVIATPIDAKEFGWSLRMIEQGLAEEGIDMSVDNAYQVTVGDDEIIFSATVAKVKS